MTDCRWHSEHDGNCINWYFHDGENKVVLNRSSGCLNLEYHGPNFETLAIIDMGVSSGETEFVDGCADKLYDLAEQASDWSGLSVKARGRLRNLLDAFQAAKQEARQEIRQESEV